MTRAAFPHRRAVLGGAGALALWPACAHAAPPARGQLTTWTDFPSSHIAARTVWVWTPPGYAQARRRCPVIYMQDGQNLFDTDLATFGEWGMDEALSALIDTGRTRGAVVVGAANSPLRRREYLPEGYMSALPALVRGEIEQSVGGPAMSGAYVRFLTEELKPAIEQAFRVRTDPANTFIMGSSMGGLIALEALFQRPDVFGAAACLSTHWPLRFAPFDSADAIVGWQEALLAGVVDYVGAGAPAPGRHRFWFDHGTLNLDRWYRPYQLAADAAFQRRGFTPEADYRSAVYYGADHNEASWSARVQEPLRFLLRLDDGAHT